MTEHKKSLLAIVVASTLALTACGGSSNDNNSTDSGDDTTNQQPDNGDNSGDDNTNDDTNNGDDNSGDDSGDDTNDNGGDAQLGEFSPGVWVIQNRSSSAGSVTEAITSTLYVDADGTRTVTGCGADPLELTEDDDDTDPTDGCEDSVTSLGTNHWRVDDCEVEGDFTIVKKVSDGEAFIDGTLSVTEASIDSSNVCLTSLSTSAEQFNSATFMISSYQPERFTISFTSMSGAFAAQTYSGSEFSATVTSATLADSIGSQTTTLTVLPGSSTLTIDEVSEFGYKGTYSLAITTDFTTVATTVTGAFDVQVDSLISE